MSTVIDFATARPSVAFIKKANISGVLRYVCNEVECPGKSISVAEASEYHAGGIPFGLVYEDGANDFSGGATVGAAKAKIAEPILAALVEAELFGATRPVYCAVDGNLPQSAYAITYAGIHAFCSALGRPDAIYGPRPFLLWCEQKLGVEFLWELGSSSFNTGPEPKNKRLQQLVVKPPVVGTLAGVDYDTALMSDWGQWPAPAAPKPPKPETADEYAAKEGMVIIDRAEALLAATNHPDIAWYLWVPTHTPPMVGHSEITDIPVGKTIYAFRNVLDAAGIPHAGA